MAHDETVRRFTEVVIGISDSACTELIFVGGTTVPLNAARTAQRAVRYQGSGVRGVKMSQRRLLTRAALLDVAEIAREQVAF